MSTESINTEEEMHEVQSSSVYAFMSKIVTSSTLLKLWIYRWQIKVPLEIEIVINCHV